jgi:hypothetical protein
MPAKVSDDLNTDNGKTKKRERNIPATPPQRAEKKSRDTQQEYVVIALFDGGSASVGKT